MTLGTPPHPPPDILKNNCSKKISTWKIVPREIDPPPQKKCFPPQQKSRCLSAKHIIQLVKHGETV